MTEAQKWYQEYLTSTHWQDMRRRAFAKYGTRCSIVGCTIKKLNIHHLSYEFVGTDQEIQDVRPVCWWHHKLCHFKIWQWRKVPLNRAHLTRRYMEVKRFTFLRMRVTDWFRL